MAKNRAETVVRELFDLAGITINGGQPYDIKVHNDALFRRVLKHEALGLGESYMDGWWDCEALDQFIDKIFQFAESHSCLSGGGPTLRYWQRSFYSYAG